MVDDKGVYLICEYTATSKKSLDNNIVIANEVKQSHLGRCLRLPRPFRPRNDLAYMSKTTNV